MRLLCLLSFLHGLEASRISLADVQGLFSRQRLSSDQAVVSNRSVTSLDATTSKKKEWEPVDGEKHPCSQVVSGAEDRERSHWFGGDCKCPAGYVVAGKSWECKDALGKQKFSSKIGPTKCHCAATSECESMVLGAKQRNSYKKNPDRPCKCEDHDFVLEGKAPQCAVFLGERYFPNTLPPQRISLSMTAVRLHMEQLRRTSSRRDAFARRASSWVVKINNARTSMVRISFPRG
eukprot:g22851.t1